MNPLPDSDANRPPSRGTWGSDLGFVLAAVGSAVGLGNMWRFPATASSSGGAAFVVLYVALTFGVGIPLLMAELALGRKARLSPVGALRRVAGRAWVPVGWLFVISGFTIFAFYSVIAGWTVRYGVEVVLAGLPADPASLFREIATGPAAAGYHLAFVAATVGVVFVGVRRGIERAAVILMPTLFVILVGLALWAATLDGAGEGYAFYLRPDVAGLLDPGTLAGAAGQTYFSLSLGLGGMLTYASYLERESDLGLEGTAIALTDFGVAFLAGLVIFPVVFALGFSEQVVGLTATQSSGVLFIALPGAFGQMPTWGRLVAIVFFLALSVAALTSTIALLELVVSSVIDEFHLSRRTAALIVGAGIGVVGLVPSFSLSALGAMNTLVGEVMLPLGAFLTVIVVGWVMEDPVEELGKGASPTIRRTLPAWYFVVRWVLPVVTGGVLYFTLQAKLGL